MFDGKLLQRAAITGITLEVTLAVIGHYVPYARAHAYYEFCAMMIAGLVGLFYARDFAKGYARGALGGALAGGASGLIGICAANIIGDEPLIALAIGTAILTMVGAIGGLFGQLGADIRKLKA
ncbi:MAG TPA: hypothetical protein VHZ78_13570 [Rhizomicrobium sp.]|nr:hypothetical protein [Rhizomicrobium sp.]